MSLGGGPREHGRAAGQGRKSLGCMGAEDPVGNGGSAPLGTSRRRWWCLTEGMRKPDYLPAPSFAGEGRAPEAGWNICVGQYFSICSREPRGHQSKDIPAETGAESAVGRRQDVVEGPWAVGRALVCALGRCFISITLAAMWRIDWGT